MSYSLLNKFRGAWLGSYLGHYPKTIKVDQKELPRWSKIAEIGAQSLISLGDLNLTHYREQVRLSDPSLLNLVGSANLGEAIWATLPVILFFQEQPHKLAPKLLSALEFWLHSQESAPTGLAMGEAIALLLDKNSDPLDIIDQTDLGKTLGLSTKFWQDLPCLETAIKEITRHTPPSQIPLAIACYCFLCTPKDFSLSIRRATLFSQAEITATLVGILSGAYNGLSGMPFNWYGELLDSSLTLSPNSSGDFKIGGVGEVSHNENRLHLSDRLFTTWAGHYHPPEKSWRNHLVTHL